MHIDLPAIATFYFSFFDIDKGSLIFVRCMNYKYLLFVLSECV
jgi:hypothetical protein